MAAEIYNLASRKNIGSAKGLLQSLVPRAQCFCFYGLNRNCDWSSDGVDDYEIDNFVAELPDDLINGTSEDSKYLRRTLTSGRTLLAMPIFAGDEEGLGILVSVFSKNAGKSSWFNPSLLHNILQPAIRMIGDSLRNNLELQVLEDRAAAAESELKLVYQVDEKIHGTSRSHAGLAQLIGQSGRYLGIAYSVLLMPSKRIRISATHSSWKKVNRKAVDKYLLDTLFPRLDPGSGPVIFEIPAVEGSENPAEQGYQALLCPLLDGNGNVEGIVAQLGRVSGQVFDDSSKRFMSHIVRKVEYVIEQSFDSMTGLMNRSGFEAQLQESMKSLDGNSDAHQIIYFDLDNLQLVNDTFDRSAGDDVIIRFAQLIEEHLPKNAVATRLANDEFVILLTHSSTDDALSLAENIRKDGHVLRYLKGDKSLQVTVSVGISELGKNISAGDAMTGARFSCDSAKDHGRDRVEIYDQGNRSIIQRYDDMQMVSEIQKNLDTDGFTLFAQPIVALAKEDQTRRYEILLRMNDKKGARVSSSAFFSAAERYQLMPQIDRWVVSTTLARLSEYTKFLEDTGTQFAINLSGQSLGDDEILTFVEDEIDASGVPNESLCFEVTESAAVSSLNKAQAFIDALRKRGCRFSLDDFGAGLSSFAYLKNFNVDVLKIDGSFIRDITSNRISESMVAAITQVAKVMELETVAEYVESKQTKKLIVELGVDYAQGHAVGKPIELDGVLEDLTGQHRKSTA
jgi:diguanylate cyclase (GGDEF)-like protein